MIAARFSPAAEPEAERVLRLGRVRIEVVLVEADDELLRLEAKPVVEQLDGLYVVRDDLHRVGAVTHHGRVVDRHVQRDIFMWI